MLIRNIRKLSQQGDAIQKRVTQGVRVVVGAVQDATRLRQKFPQSCVVRLGHIPRTLQNVGENLEALSQSPFALL